jgi:hypothetical protein
MRHHRPDAIAARFTRSAPVEYRTAAALAMDCNEKMSSRWPDTMICCRCGRTFDRHRLEDTPIHYPASPQPNDPMKFAADPPFAGSGAPALAWLHQSFQGRNRNGPF